MFLFETEQAKLKPVLDDVRGAQWISVDKVSNYLILDDDKKFFSLNKNIILSQPLPKAPEAKSKAIKVKVVKGKK